MTRNGTIIPLKGLFTLEERRNIGFLPALLMSQGLSAPTFIVESHYVKGFR
jgi:hypothetical protein